MKVIRKSIEIAASGERIWEVLLQEPHSRIWLAVFNPGSHAVTDWQLGSKVIFTDGSGSGIFGRIITHEPCKVITFEYDGFIYNNVEDTESEEAKVFIGTHETYRLTPKGDKTLLEIESDMSDGFFEEMSKQWDVALQTIESLATSE